MKSFYILLIALSGGYLTAQLFAWVFFEKLFFPDGGELFERRKNKAEWQTVFPKNMLLLIIFVFSASLIGLLTYIAGVSGWVSMLMGAVGGLLQVDAKTVNDLMFTLQPAGINTLAGKTLDARERDIERAKIVRERL